MSETTNPLGLVSIPSVSSEGLVPVGKRLSLFAYLASLWDRRHFIIAESRAKMTGSTRKNLLGYAWLFINPLLSVLAFWFIFGFILQTSAGVENFLGYLVIGVFFFGFTSKCMTGGTASIRSGAAMIRAFQFPRAALPLSTVVKDLLDFIPTLGVMILILAIVPPAEHLTWRIVLIVPIIALQTIFNLGLACFMARIGHNFPDFGNLISIISRFWLYGSGVFFVIDDKLSEFPKLLTLMHLNPMYSFLELSRNALLYGVDSPLWMWVSASLWAFGLIMIGFYFFWKGEESYGRPRI